MQNRRSFIKNSSLLIGGTSIVDFMNRYGAPVGDGKLNLEIYATNWGFDGTMDAFCAKAKKDGYDGIEVWAPAKKEKQDELLHAVVKHNLKLGVLAGNWGNGFEQQLDSFKTSLGNAVSLKPEFINCHSGKDFFSREQGGHFIEHAFKMSTSSGIPIYHETHRGRILYAAPVAKEFIDTYEYLRLTLDISHWCCVHESLLANQKATIDQALKRVDHIHSRVGFAEAPQIPNHDDPKYAQAVKAHFTWWDEVVRLKSESGEKLTMTTEFGPPPYMWTHPYSNKPLADVWEVNVAMKEVWEKRYLT